MKVCPECGLKYADEDVRCFVDKAVLEVLDDPMIGTVLKGRYEIESVLGEGGMAVVYRARNTLVERAVAVKVMDAGLRGNAELLERFRREAKNAAAIAHPNIIEIYDHGKTEDGIPFLVMELLEGEPLHRTIERGPIPVSTAAAIGVQIARGLARAHDFSVLHRDLKPENIFLSDAGPSKPPTVKILDFGIARSMHDKRLTTAGQIFGTPQYMAPERVTSIDAGPSADLYAVGVILFEMLTGRLPFESQEITGYFIKHMKEEPPHPSHFVPGIPPRFEGLILALLAKDPNERPVDAHAVMKVLEQLVPKTGPDSVPPPVAARPVAAPKLAPVTIERWDQRAGLFEEMLRRAFPARDEQALENKLGEIKLLLRRVRQLREAGLVEQRKLEALEQQVRDARERLGHAVHVLAADLSSAREAARAQARPGSTDKRQRYINAFDAFIAAGGSRSVEAPSTTLVGAAREMAAALQDWETTSAGAVKAAEVADLEFQVEALRKQLERVESQYEQDREAAEEVLRSKGEESNRLEEKLMRLGSEFVAPLRSRDNLNDLFARLKTDAAVGIDGRPEGPRVSAARDRG